MRKLLIILVLLIGLAIGYLAGCRSRVQSRTVTSDPLPGQVWRDREGHERVVRAVTREGSAVQVWWHRDGASGPDRHCTVETWHRWARRKGGRIE